MMAHRKIKICQVQLLPLMTGVQRSMLYVLCKLDREKFDIYVICKEEGDLTQELRRLDIKYILVPSVVREIRPHKDIYSLYKLYRIFRNFKFDIIHTQSSKTGFLGRAAAFLAGTPFIFHTVHGFPFHEFSPQLVRKFYAFMERIGARLSNCMIFVNNEEREMAIREHLVAAHKTMTVYNGVNFNLVREKDSKSVRRTIRQKWGIPPKDFVVGYVGRLWEQKDPLTLLKIIDLCRNKPFRFLIIGDGPYQRHFIEAADENKNIILAGWIDDVFSYYPAMDVMVLPSLWEGLPLSLIEAMAFGKPIVASNIKGNRECMRHGANGFLCTPRAAEEFVMAIEKLSRDHTLYQKLSKNARESSHKHFDSDVNNQVIINLYEKVFTTNRGESNDRD